MRKTILILITVILLAGCESYKTIVKNGKTYYYKNNAYYDTRGKKYNIDYKIVNGKYESRFVEVE